MGVKFATGCLHAPSCHTENFLVAGALCQSPVSPGPKLVSGTWEVLSDFMGGWISRMPRLQGTASGLGTRPRSSRCRHWPAGRCWASPGSWLVYLTRYMGSQCLLTKAWGRCSEHVNTLSSFLRDQGKVGRALEEKSWDSLVVPCGSGYSLAPTPFLGGSHRFKPPWEEILRHLSAYTPLVMGTSLLTVVEADGYHVSVAFKGGVGTSGSACCHSLNQSEVPVIKPLAKGPPLP